MQWIDPYATMYQKANGFPITILAEPKNKNAFLSLKPTTRAAYDLSMRENSIDGIVTMDKISEELKSGDMFYINCDKKGIYIIQTLSFWEQQPETRNINAVKTNCLIEIKRFGQKDENSIEEEWFTVYDNIRGFISETLKDGKNFDAGIEVATVKIVQIPKRDLNNNKFEVYENDRIVVKDLENNSQKCFINVESTDSFGVSGIIRLQGTQDTRSD